MTLMLASVTGPDEAHIALQGGADIIDLKDPDRGALGAAPIQRIRETVNVVQGGRPVSATIGDWPADPVQVAAAVHAIVATGVDYVKVGLLGGGDWSACIRALRPWADQTSLIGVLFADQNPDLALLDLMAACRFRGVMYDTADKRSGSLISHRSTADLGEFVTRSKRRGLLTGLAGSLRVGDIPTLLSIAPDYLGFRTALCHARERNGSVALDCIVTVRDQIPRAHARSDSATCG